MRLIDVDPRRFADRTHLDMLPGLSRSQLKAQEARLRRRWDHAPESVRQEFGGDFNRFAAEQIRAAFWV